MIEPRKKLLIASSTYKFFHRLNQDTSQKDWWALCLLKTFLFILYILSWEINFNKSKSLPLAWTVIDSTAWNRYNLAFLVKILSLAGFTASWCTLICIELASWLGNCFPISCVAGFIAFALALAWSLVFCSSCLRGPLAVYCWLVYSCAGNCCTCLETCLRNRVLDCNICMKLLHWLGAWFPRSLCSRTNCIWLLALALRLVWVVRRH